MKSKPSEKKRTLKLKISDDIRYKLIGISCHENDYRLVWAINTRLKMQFVRIENLVVHSHQHKSDLEFSRFTYIDEDRYITYNLISNRCPDGFLFPEIRNFDFLIQVIGETTDAEIRDLNKKLKAAEVISATFVLHPEKIKGIKQILDT